MPVRDSCEGHREFLAVGSLPLLVLTLRSKRHVDELPLMGEQLALLRILKAKQREVNLIAMTIATPSC